MDGVHDLGGKPGFGQVQVNDAVPADLNPSRAGFAERWHAVVFATLRALPAAGALQNSDQFRHAVERIDPQAYLTHGYYGRWLGGIENLLVEAGVITSAELDARTPTPGTAARPATRPVKITQPPQAEGSVRKVATPPKFELGQMVVTSTVPTPGHTRLPAYSRGKVGRITALHQGWIFPDTNASGQGESPCHLYTVTFSGESLWGPGTETNNLISLDLFEPYLSLPNDAAGEQA